MRPPALLADHVAILVDSSRGVWSGRGRQRWRRLSWLVLWLVVWHCWSGFAALCLLLDRLLWARIEAVPVTAPLFMTNAPAPPFCTDSWVMAPCHHPPG